MNTIRNDSVIWTQLEKLKCPYTYNVIHTYYVMGSQTMVRVPLAWGTPGIAKGHAKKFEKNCV